MGGLRASNDVVLFKTETTYNTDPVPTAGSNAIFVTDPQLSQEGLRMTERPGIRGSLGQLQRIYGGELRKMSFKTEIKGSGAAGTAPEIGPLLKACGMSETVVASTSVTYKPSSALPHSSGTLYYYEGGRKLHILTGCRGKLKLSLANAGGILMAEIEMTGHYTQATDQSQPSPVYNSQVPKPALGLSSSFNGVSAIVIQSYELDLGNTIETSPSTAAADGFGDVNITQRDVIGSLMMESELDSVIDIDSLLATGTRFAFSAGTIGSVAGNRVALSTPASSTYITATDPGSNNGVRNRKVSFAVDDSTSDQEVSIAFS